MVSFFYFSYFFLSLSISRQCKTPFPISFVLHPKIKTHLLSLVRFKLSVCVLSPSYFALFTTACAVVAEAIDTFGKSPTTFFS